MAEKLKVEFHLFRRFRGNSVKRLMGAPFFAIVFLGGEYQDDIFVIFDGDVLSFYKHMSNEIYAALFNLQICSPCRCVHDYISPSLLSFRLLALISIDVFLAGSVGISGFISSIDAW